MSIGLLDSILSYRLTSAGFTQPASLTLDDPQPLESDPYNSLAAVESSLVALSGYGQLLDASSRLQTNFTNAESSADALSSNTSVATVSGVSSTSPSASSISVIQVAKAQERQSTATADPDALIYGKGKFKINLTNASGASAGSTTVTISASQGSLNGIRDAINAKSAGITASVEQNASGYYLSLKGNEVGTNANTFTLTSSSASSGFSKGLTKLGLTETQTRQNAVYNVNGSGTNTTSTSNDVTVGGVNLSLVGAGSTNVYFPRVAGTQNSGVATASASSTATPGNYTVSVSQAAKGQELTSAAYAVDPSTIQYGTGAFTIQTSSAADPTTVNVSTGSLNGIRDAINNANAGVSASIGSNSFGYFLTIKGNQVGASADTFSIDSTLDPFTSFRNSLNALGFSQTQAPQDASYTITQDPTTLAKEQINTSGLFASASATALNGGVGGTFTIQASNATYATTITLGTGEDTLNGVRDAINAANAGVTASIGTSGANSYLEIKGNRVGAGETFTIGAGTLNLTTLASLTQTQAPAASVGGTVVSSGTSSSNSIALSNGATITLQGAGTTNLTVGQDIAGLTQSAQNLVSNYNSLLATLNSLTATGGALDPTAGDTTAQTFQTDLYNRVNTAQASNGNSALLTLSSLGISNFTASSTSPLQLNETTLTTAFASDPVGASALLNTYTEQLKTIVEGYAGTGGTILASTTSVNSQITSASTAIAGVSNGTNTIQQLITSGSLPSNTADLLAMRILASSGQINIPGLSIFA